MVDKSKLSINKQQTIKTFKRKFKHFTMHTLEAAKEVVQQKWGKRPLIISGPCSAESEEQVLQTASQLAATGKVDILRYHAGVYGIPDHVTLRAMELAARTAFTILRGTSLTSIRTVAAHPQASTQCRGWLHRASAARSRRPHGVNARCGGTRSPSARAERRRSPPASPPPGAAPAPGAC